MKRVLFVLPAAKPSWATNQAQALMPHLLAAGYDVHVCALAAGPEFNLGQPAPSKLIGGRGALDPVAWVELRRHIRRLRPQLVHAWLPTYEPRLRLLPLVERRVPWLVSQSGFQPAESWLQTHAEARHLPGVNWTVSHPVAYVRALAAGLPAVKVHAIASGVEARAKPSQARAAWIERLGLPVNVRVAGAVGHLQTQGRWKDLIWAADMLKFIRDDVHLLICGTGPQRPRLERFRKQVRINDKVHFLAARDDLADWLPHLDVFWSCREDNGQPLALLMAMAAGVPSVAARVSGAEQIVQHGRSGYLVPVGDRAGIARLTRKLLEAPADAQALGQRGRQHVIANFAVQRMADSFQGLYRSQLA